jgi:uncharacterized membrane protein YsdA (DUF1294 family)/cold shock CspA family protein
VHRRIVRTAGRISGWNEARGYGFVVPNGGGERVFVHIKAFPRGTRRPVDGDVLSFATTTDRKGRIQAIDVRLAGQADGRKPRGPLPRAAIGFTYLLATLVGAFVGLVPAVIPAGHALLGGAAFLMYTQDKAAAKKGGQRTPEGTLHFIDLLGGWPGALVAQQRSHHKTAKASFQWTFWFTVVANVAAMVWLVRSGVARDITTLLLAG